MFNQDPHTMLTLAKFHQADVRRSFPRRSAKPGADVTAQEAPRGTRVPQPRFGWRHPAW